MPLQNGPAILKFSGLVPEHPHPSNTTNDQLLPNKGPPNSKLSSPPLESAGLFVETLRSAWKRHIHSNSGIGEITKYFVPLNAQIPDKSMTELTSVLALVSSLKSTLC